jgi:hypothetical protein
MKHNGVGHLAAALAVDAAARAIGGKAVGGQQDKLVRWPATALFHNFCG